MSGTSNLAIPAAEARPQLADLMAFLDASPSPWHAAASAAARLSTAGFTELRFDHAWDDIPAKGFVRRGAALVAWHRGVDAGPTAPVRIVGAHTDLSLIHI